MFGRLFVFCTVLFVFLLQGSLAHAQRLNPTQIVVFGDSQSSKCADDVLQPTPTSADRTDCNIFINNSTNSPYPVWPTIFANAVGAELLNYARAGAFSATMLPKVDEYVNSLNGEPPPESAVHIMLLNNDTVFAINSDPATLNNAAVNTYAANIKSIVQKLHDAGAKNIFYIDIAATGRVATWFWGSLQSLPRGATPGIPDACEGETTPADFLNCVEGELDPLFQSISNSAFTAASEVTGADLTRLSLTGFLKDIEENMTVYGFRSDIWGYCWRLPPGLDAAGIRCEKFPTPGFSETNFGDGDGQPDQFVWEDSVHWGPRTYEVFAALVQEAVQNKTTGVYNFASFNFQTALTTRQNDTDGDGVPNATDPFPDNPVEGADADNDGIGDSGDVSGASAGIGITIMDAPAACTFNGPVTATDPGNEGAPGAPIDIELAFRIDNCGSPVTIQAKFGDPLPPGSQAFKRVGSVWTPIPGAVVSGNTITYQVTDGGPLDADGVVNGSITDPVTAVSSAGSTAVPVMPLWTLLLAALAALALGAHATRRAARA